MMAFLMSDPKEPGTFSSIGEITATTEEGPDSGRVLMIRGFGQVTEKGKLVDIPLVMQTMPGAIRSAITSCMAK